MTEDVKVEDTGSTVQEPQLTGIEQEALAQGWVPKEEFQGDPSRWVDAGEFVRRGELFSKIEAQKRDLKRTQEDIQALKQHLAAVKEGEYKRALATLRAERNEAIGEGDYDKVTKLEEKMDAVKEEAQKAVEQIKTVTQEAQQVAPEFARWVERNSWYASQPHMKTFADTVGIRLAQMGMDPAEVLKKVELEVRKEFPNKFQNPNQQRASAVEGGSSKPTSKVSSASFELTEQETRIMNNLVRSKTMTKEQYIADLKAIKGVK